MLQRRWPKLFQALAASRALEPPVVPDPSDFRVRNLSHSSSFVRAARFLDQLLFRNVSETPEKHTPESLIRAAQRFINSLLREIKPSASEAGFLCHQFFLPSKFKGCHRQLLEKANPSIKF